MYEGRYMRMRVETRISRSFLLRAYTIHTVHANLWRDSNRDTHVTFSDHTQIHERHAYRHTYITFISVLCICYKKNKNGETHMTGVCDTQTRERHVRVRMHLRYLHTQNDTGPPKETPALTRLKRHA